MPMYQYRAVNQAGAVVQGKVEASNPQDLDRRVARLGLSIISSNVAGGRLSGLTLFQRSISRDELAQFCFYVERLVAGGVPLLEGLADVRDSVSNVTLRNTVGVLIQDIEQGNTMSQAMKKHPKVFDGIFISLVEAGEQSGELDVVLRNIGHNIKWQDEIIKKTKKIFRYPIAALIVMLIATYVLMVAVVPGIVKVLKTLGGELPVYTIALINTSEFVENNLIAIVVAAVAIYIGVVVAVKAVPGMDYVIDRFKIRMPVFGSVFEKLLFSRFANVFGLLYGAGVGVIDGLKISRGAIGNKFIAVGMDDIIVNISNGSSISQAFRDSGLFPPLVLRMLRLGETTGGVDTAMEQIKNYYDRDANEAIETAQGAIQPIMMAFLAGLLIWVIVAVYAPLYDLLGKIET